MGSQAERSALPKGSTGPALRPIAARVSVFVTVWLTAGTAASAQTPTLAYALHLVEQASFSQDQGGQGSASAADFTALDLDLSGRLAGERLAFDVTSGTQLRAFHDGRGVRFEQQWAEARLDAKISRRTGLGVTSRASFGASYAPRSPIDGALGSGDDGKTPGGVEIAALRNTGVSTAITLSRRVSRKIDARLSYSLGRVSYLDRGVTVTTSSAAANLTRDLGDGVLLDLGYHLSRAVSAEPQSRLTTTAHETSMAVRVSPASWSKSTIVAGVMPTLAHRSATGRQSADRADGRYTLRLGAMVRVDHDVSLRVRVSLGYQRALYSDEGYVQPSFVQTGGGRAEMTIARGITGSLSAAYSTGLASATLPGTSLDRLDAGGRLSVRFSRRVAGAVEFQGSAYRQAAGTGMTVAAAPNGRTLRFTITLTPSSR